MAKWFRLRSENESLEAKLLYIGLEKNQVEFIIKKGEQFLNDPDILAEKLEIEPKKAKKALTELKAFKEKQLTLEIKKFEELIERNPTPSLKKLALLNDIDDDVVLAYTESLNTKKLTESQKLIIKEKYNAEFSIAEIAEELKASTMKIREYVEKNFIMFKGTEGDKVLAIIYKNFGVQPIMKLREMIVNKNMKLQERLCCELEKNKPKEYKEVKKYFEKFLESQNFFEIDNVLSNEAKKCIRTSTLEDIDELSIKLNRVGKVIRDYLLQFSPDKELMQEYAKVQFEQIQKTKLKFRFGGEISHITYRMIISDTLENLIENAKASVEKSAEKIFEKLLPIALYHLKCSLPLNEISQIFADLTNISLTPLDIFHLIFQMADPILRGLCIEHYSFSNPVPFYYPRLNSHIVKKTKSSYHQLRETVCQFEICKELWFSLQQFNGLVSFGLGWASWNPIGKSHLLDLMFKTDFVKGSPQTSPFHLNSIDIQMTKNLVGKKDEKSNESTQWAYIDCHGCSDPNVIRDICQNLDIALVHVSYSDYTQNTHHFEKELHTIAANTKHVYVLVRDYPENHQDILQVTKSGKTKFLFIPNLTKCDMQLLLTPLKKFGHTILHSTTESPRLVESNFLENLINHYCSWNNVGEEKSLIEKIKSTISPQGQDPNENKSSYLSYYPNFIEYMLCFYKVSDENDQIKIDELNEKCEQLLNTLESTNISIIVHHFNGILGHENSTLILWKLSQELRILSKKLGLPGKTVYTLEILWREAVLSNKYYDDKGDSNKLTKYFSGKFSSSFSNHVERGEPFELIDGDNLRFFNQEIDALLSKLYEKLNNERISIENENRPPIVVSIFGPQSSGKSTLLNYCFGCKFLTSAGRCTKGVYASLSKLSRPINRSDHFLILDTEGLDAIERGKTLEDTSCINFDRTMVLFCLAVSQAVIINVKSDIGEEMRNLLQICAYSLNKLKVSKVAAPKIFFVLNQQADPDPEKHLSSINTLLVKLNKESYLMEIEGAKISDLIHVSERNLFILPSAFNSEPMNTQISKLFDSDLSKLSPNESFANKCADLRMSIMHQLDDAHDTKTPFNTMSEWMEMSGVIWDTIIKYQDIVKYRNVEELKCSISLHKIVNDLMSNTIHRNKLEYQSITEELTRSISAITRWSTPNVILENVKKGLDEVFNPYLDEALTDFKEKCLKDSLLKRMGYMCEEAQSNMSRLMYTEKKIYEDKLKIAIKARLTEIQHSKSMKEFQEHIEKNVDIYVNLSIEAQRCQFEEVWAKCFKEKKDEENTETDEKFEDLYSVFMIESKTMEKKQVIYDRFRKSEFNMDKISKKLVEDMYSNFISKTNRGTGQFFYPWRENRGPINEMTPYIGNREQHYLNRKSLFYTKVNNDSGLRRKCIEFENWVPPDCLPLAKYCSGYFNHPDIIWNPSKTNQILLLASQLKDPDDFKSSTWLKCITDIKTGVENICTKEANISHSTVKEIVNFLCNICKVVNYEINFIEAKLTIAAERTISTYAFFLAFKSIFGRKMEKERENALKKEKKEKTQYFLQKVENRKLAKGNWDRKEMRRGQKIIANTFAGDFLAGVWREINATCEQSIDEEYFDKEKDGLSHKSILLLANARIKEMLLRPEEPVDKYNFVVQFICKRAQCLKLLFQEKWNFIANILRTRIVENMRKKFDTKITMLENILGEFLRQLKTMCEEKQRLEEMGTDSDSSFEIVDQAATEESNNDSKIRVIPLKAMVSFLKMYLDPKVSPQAFKQFFNNVFEIDSVKVRKHPKSYVLFEKPNNPEHILDEETFKKLSDTNMFAGTEAIFNIQVYLEEFLDALNSYQFRMTETEYENLLEATKEKFEARVINCPRQCPSCGKFCEKELHPNGGRCQIISGHQMCSMGGNVWNTDENRTAVLLMCEDYKDHSPVLIPGQNMTWGKFKEKYCNEWDWDLPTDQKYVALQNENREMIKGIWKMFGKQILEYYRDRGTHITHAPYTSREEIYDSIFSPIYYVCFVIDGTDLMGDNINSVKSRALDVMENTTLEKGRSKFKIIAYHGHTVDTDKKCIEMFPTSCDFTTDNKMAENFLESIEAYGGEDNELAMLDGLATATTKCGWKSGLGIKNLIIHIYVEPTEDNFDIYAAKGRCTRGFDFDWERDIGVRMKELNIEYKSRRLVSSSHPDYPGSIGKDYIPSKININSGDEPKPKGDVFIGLKTDF